MTKAELQKENEKLQARIRVLEGQQLQSSDSIRTLGAEGARHAANAAALEWALVLAHRQSRMVPWTPHPGDSLAIAT